MRRALGWTLTVMAAGCASAKASLPKQSQEETVTEADLKAIIDHAEEQLKPLELAANQTWYAASVSGTDEDWAKNRAAEVELNTFLADPKLYAKVITARKAGVVKDPLLARELTVLYLTMLGRQVEPALLEKITGIETAVEQTFNGYRGRVKDKEVTQNEINNILRTSRDSVALRQAWEAQKAVGPLIAPKLAEVVKLRNELAKRLGFRDFYALRLAEDELDEEMLLELFDDLDTLTREPFSKAKAEVDKRLAKRLKVPVAELKPWHYQNPFFQEPPDVFGTGLEPVYQKQDTLALCRKFYKSIGLDVEKVIARSDLLEKKGKTPHAFEVDLDRGEDVRVIGNIVAGAEWQATMLHELGHAVYDVYLDPSLPWLLRRPAHPLTTEGVAMMFERLVRDPQWAEAMGLMPAKKAQAALPEAKAEEAFAVLLFSRWTQVMLRFERAMYGNPDQDLSKLWWDLVEKYQALKRPPDRNAPDYASKIHIVVAPVYYHNYMLGRLFAAQLHDKLSEIEGRLPEQSVYANVPGTGDFLKKEVFAPGALYPWNELTRRATGKELVPEAFARKFKD